MGAAPLLKQPLPRPYEKRQVTAPEQPSTSAKTPLSSLSYSSVSDTGSLDSVQPDIGPPTPSRIIGTPGKKKGKWYVVIVGRKTGIFDDWCVIHPFPVSFLIKHY